MQSALRILFILFFAYVLYALAGFLLQRKLMFPRHLLSSEDVEISSRDKVIRLDMDFGRVKSILATPDHQHKGPWPLIIFAHGNAERIEDWPEIFRPLTDEGVAVYMVEYPGYGSSQGTPSQTSITQTFVKAYDTIIESPHIDKKQILFMGRSIGGGAVCRLARFRPSNGLILISSMTSTWDLAKKFLVPPFLIRDPFNNLKVVRSYEKPVLVIHGRKDSIIPFEHGKKLAEAAPQGTFIPLNCGHNDVPLWNPEFWDPVFQFLKQTGAETGSIQ